MINLETTQYIETTITQAVQTVEIVDPQTTITFYQQVTNWMRSFTTYINYLTDALNSAWSAFFSIQSNFVTICGEGNAIHFNPVILTMVSCSLIFMLWHFVRGRFS